MTSRDGTEPGMGSGEAHRLVDPRAVRVSPAVPGPGDPPPVVLEPPRAALVPDTHLGGRGPLGGIVEAPIQGAAGPAPAATEDVVVDGATRQLELRRLDAARVAVTERHGTEVERFRAILLSAPQRADASAVEGVVRREVLVDGWSIEVEIESERRASLRERARRATDAAQGGGPTEVRAIIPGRIVSVSVAPGDRVEAGQQLLVVEAMKMQNELRAPRDGTIDAVAVAPGDTIEVRDLLLVLS